MILIKISFFANTHLHFHFPLCQRDDNRKFVYPQERKHRLFSALRFYCNRIYDQDLYIVKHILDECIMILTTPFWPFKDLQSTSTKVPYSFVTLWLRTSRRHDNNTMKKAWTYCNTTTMRRCDALRTRNTSSKPKYIPYTFANARRWNYRNSGTRNTNENDINTNSHQKASSVS